MTWDSDNVARVAPVGTAIRCAACEAEVATLIRAIGWGDVIRHDAVELATGATPMSGMAVACHVCGNERGFYVVVEDRQWWIG